MKRINRTLLMGHEYLARALVKLMQIGKTSSRSNAVLHHAPEAFDGVEVVPTVGREAMEAQLAVGVSEGRVELVRPMEPTPIDDHHDLFRGCPEDRQHLVHILAQLLGIKMRADLREDFRGAILDGAHDAEQHAAGEAAPRTILPPRLAFAAFFAFDVALAQRPCWETSTGGFPPPASTGEGKTPQDGLIFIEHNDLATASTVLQGGECERGIGKVSGGGSEPPRRATGADVFFLTPLGRSRGSPARRSGVPRRWRVPDNSTENRENHVGGGLRPRGDRGAWPVHR
jgi:hypothetical protein